MIKFQNFISLSSYAALIMTPTTVLAQDTGVQSSEDNIAYAGAGAVIFSEYLGSADQDISPLPYLSQIGRNSNDSPNLIGFEDVGGSIPVGGYVRSTVGPLGIRLDAGQDVISGHNGFTADASVGTFYRLGNWAIQPSASVSWADSNHNKSFFGVTANQAAGSPLGGFDIGSGIYAYSANVVTWIEFQEKYALTLIATYRKFTNDAKDSPILRADDGSTDGVYAAISISRKFDLSNF